MFGTHAGLRFEESAALLIIWRHWCDALLKLFSAGGVLTRLSAVQTHAKVWFNTRDPSDVRRYLDQKGALTPQEFDSRLGIPVAQVGNNAGGVAYSAAAHLLLNSVFERY